MLGDNCAELVQAGALDVALYAMEMFYTGEALQEYCCRMLANMALASELLDYEHAAVSATGRVVCCV